MPKSVYVMVSVNTETLASELVQDMNQDELIEFVMFIDQFVGEVEFTAALRDKLQAELDTEELQDL